MLNENYRKFIGGILGGKTDVVLTPYAYNNSYDNTKTYSTVAWNRVTDPNAPANTNTYTGISIILGSGDTQPTIKDVKLSNDVTKNLSYIAGSTSKEENSEYSKLVPVTYKNNTANTVTVKEVGLMMQETPSGSSFYRKALLGRVVLDAPIVMSPGDTYTFTYIIE